MPEVTSPASQVLLRPDLLAIAGRMRTNEKVLDLGCGDGTLLRYLMDARQVTGRGIELSEAGVLACVGRGFLAVDVSIKGQAYRVFNTHLEQRLLAPDLPETRLLQVGQAIELAQTALLTWDGARRVIVVGDMNSDPSDTIPVPPNTMPIPTPYTVFTLLNGFTDARTMRRNGGEGDTCCQAEDLANRRTALYERIDMIFSLTPPTHVLDMRLLWNRMGEKTRPPGHGGLWPSDHAALAAGIIALHVSHLMGSLRSTRDMCRNEIASGSPHTYDRPLQTGRRR